MALWSKEAREEWNRFYTTFEGAERPPLLMEAVKRCPVYVRKLSLVYAAAEATLPEITAPQLKAAIAVIGYAIECTERLIDLKSADSRLHSNGELETRILDWLKKRRVAKVRDLQQAMSKYCDAGWFNRVLEGLEKADRVEREWDRSGPKQRRLIYLKD